MAGGRTSRQLPLALALAAPLTLLLLAVLVFVMVAAATGATPVNLPDFSTYLTDAQPAPEKVKASWHLQDDVVPASDPAALRPVSQIAAMAINAAIPVTTIDNPAASRFMTGQADVGSWARSLECLTAAVYYEAASESVDGQRAVAQVVLNRVRHPAYPHTICGVVFQGSERQTGCQFTFTCDGSLGRIPSRHGWARAQGVAGAALGGYVYAPVGWATHYHTDWVVPYWASTLLKTAVVGAHIFYRWNGGWGRAAAFTSHYVGVEPASDWQGKGKFADMPEQAEVSLSGATGGVAMTGLEDRPVIERAARVGAAPDQQKYVSAERRWVLGGDQLSVPASEQHMQSGAGAGQ